LERSLSIPGRLAILAAAVVLLPAFLPQKDSSAESRAKFDRETNPVRRAKMLPQLGNAEFQDIQNDVSAGNFDDALKMLGLYRDQAASTEKALNASEPDAAKHSGGYRQLEISVREALRHINDILFSVPMDQKKAFSDIRDQLDQMDQRLIRRLFPREQPAVELPPQPAL
jgi:hypothetical protein